MKSVRKSSGRNRSVGKLVLGRSGHTGECRTGADEHSVEETGELRSSQENPGPRLSITTGYAGREA